MRKFCLLLIISVCCVAVLAACRAPALSKPTDLAVNTSTKILTWSRVQSANGYTVDVSGVPYDVKTNSYPLSSLDEGSYSLKVKARGDGENYRDSGWSASIPFVREYESGLSFKEINSRTEYEVSGRGTAKGDVVIESVHNGKPVTSIGVLALSNYSGITSITIPDSVTNISEQAFLSCIGLESITIPATITSINKLTFAYCSKLKSITIPQGVTSIGEYAFSTCTELTEVDIPDSVTSIGEGAFQACRSLKSVTIPNRIAYISPYLFRNCLSLSKVTIGTSVTDIDKGAFQDCVSLESITIPDNVTSIGDYAFYDCAILANIEIPEGLIRMGAFVFLGTEIWNSATTEAVYVGKWVVGGADPTLTGMPLKNDTVGISDYAFYGFTKLESIEIPASVKAIGDCAFLAVTPKKDEPAETSLSEVTFQEGSLLETIGDYAFQNNYSLKTITIPEKVKKIGRGAFDETGIWNESASFIVYAGNWVVGCKNTTISGITWNPGVMGIADHSFYGCNSLESITIPDGVKTIGNNAFARCENLAAATIPDTVKSIGDYAFYECVKLAGFIIPDGVENVGRSAFYKCFGLIELIIPDSVEKIGDYAFYGCTELFKIKLSSRLTSIGRCVFYNCVSIRNIIIPDTVTSIGEHAFYGCYGATSISIPDTVTSIGEYAFYGCYGATDIKMPDALTSIGAYAFSKCNALEIIVIPDGVTSIGAYAFAYCEMLTNVIISTSVISIGNYAFRNCINLTTVTIPKSITNIGRVVFGWCDKMTIYCEAKRDEVNWNTLWNSSNRPTVWGCTLSEESYVVSFTKSQETISNPNAITGFIAPYRQGYSFDGWATTSGGAIAYTSDLINTAPDGTVLYARWKAM